MSVRDLDRLRQLHHDQTLAKWHPSPLKAEQRRWAKMPPQPDPHYTLDGGCTQTTEWRSRDGGVQESGTKIGRRNWTELGHRVRVGNAVKVESGARVIGEARARRGLRAVGMMRAWHAVGMRCRNPESGHPNVKGRDPASPPVAPRNRMGGVPSSQHPPVNSWSSSNWRRRWRNMPRVTSGGMP